MAARVDPIGLDTIALSRLVDAVPVMLWTSDAASSCTYANQALLEFVGRSLEEFAGDGWRAYVHADDVELGVRAYESAVAERRLFDFQVRLRRADGEYRWVQVCGAPQCDGSGKFERYVGSTVDITDLKQIERALRDSEERFRRLVENARDAIYRKRLKPSIAFEYASPAIYEITGYSPDEFYQDPDLMLRAVHPDDRDLLAEIVAREPSRLPEPAIIRWVHPGGRVVWAEHRRVPVYDADGELVAVEGVARNITGALETQNRLRSSEAQLRRLSARLQTAREDERSRVSRELHDDLGQALTGVQMELQRTIPELLRAGLPRLLVDRMQSIVGEIDLGTVIVRKIAADLRPPALDHLGLAAAIEHEAAAIARRTGLRCRVAAARTSNRLTPEQATAAFRVFQEAITNTMRHAGASVIHVRLRESRSEFAMDITDDGCGITAAQAADPSSLGLLGMRERTTPLGGSVSIEGQRGKGTKVTVRFPIPARAPRAGAKSGRRK